MLTDRLLERVGADNISHLSYLRLGEGRSWRRLLRTERQTTPVAIGFLRGTSSIAVVFFRVGFLRRRPEEFVTVPMFGKVLIDIGKCTIFVVIVVRIL